MLFYFSPASHAQETEPPRTIDLAPLYATIGQGAIQSVAWDPGGDYILVSTVTGAWLYTPDLQDLAHLPAAQLAALSPDGRYLAGVDDT